MEFNGTETPIVHEKVENLSVFAKDALGSADEKSLVIRLGVKFVGQPRSLAKSWRDPRLAQFGQGSATG